MDRRFELVSSLFVMLLLLLPALDPSCSYSSQFLHLPLLYNSELEFTNIKRAVCEGRVDDENEERVRRDLSLPVIKKATIQPFSCRETFNQHGS
jgi:hypothetical protein